MIRYALMILACAALIGCATVNRLAASDVSIVQAAIFVNKVSHRELDLNNFEDRLIIYESVSIVSRYNRGEITEEEAADIVLLLLDEDDQG